MHVHLCSKLATCIRVLLTKCSLLAMLETSISYENFLLCGTCSRMQNYIIYGTYCTFLQTKIFSFTGPFLNTWSSTMYAKWSIQRKGTASMKQISNCIWYRLPTKYCNSHRSVKLTVFHCESYFVLAAFLMLHRHEI